MKYSMIAFAMAGNAFATSHKNGTTALTTYCPSATTVVQGTKTFTVTEATFLTITDCLCTIVKPKPTVSVTPPPFVNNTVPVPTVIPQLPIVVPSAQPSILIPITTVLTSVVPIIAASSSVQPTIPPVFTGAASSNSIGAVAAAIAGLVAITL